MRITVIGTGYVGLTSAVALAYIGHQVTAVDTDARKIALLRRGTCPIYEAGLEALLAQVTPRLTFSESLHPSAIEAEVILIAVGTPQSATGEANLADLDAAVDAAVDALVAGQRCVLLIKSTVPIGTNRRMQARCRERLTARGSTALVAVAANPEFLREGVALHDTFYPDRVVIGADDAETLATVERMYRPLLEGTFSPPGFLPRSESYARPHLVTTDLESAEMIKYAANAFLALKISYINEIAGLCERMGADVTEVARGVGLDTRIGPRFLEAGLGWGGSCFPKDTAALLAMAGAHDYAMPIIQAARAVNDRQRLAVVEKLETALGGLSGHVIGILGLAFKPNTDDVRDSPALAVIRALTARGATVRAHDPVAGENAARELVGLPVTFAADPYTAAEGADALVLATAWDVYTRLEFSRLAATMRKPLLLDGRNCLNAVDVRAAGFTYLGMGR